jgi:hypothetical protein
MSDQLWGLEGAEECYDDQSELIGKYLDDLDIEDWPDELVLREYERDVVTRAPWLAQQLAESVLEHLDDNYGPADGHEWKRPSFEDIADMGAAINAVVSRYHVWRCEPTGKTETVDLREWVRENMAEDADAMAWLNDEEVGYEDGHC